MYPTDHVFIFFRIYIFLQISLINISMKPEVTQTNYIIPEGRLNVFTALGHMLMASAQRWVDKQCCRCLLPCPDYETPISDDWFALTVWYVGICDGCKVLNIADLFSLHGNIRPGNTTSSLFFGALKLFFDFFVFSVKMSRLYSFI